MRADFFVHPNYLALESTRHSKRAKNKPYKNMQVALVGAYANATSRVLAYNPSHGPNWNQLNRTDDDLVVKTREYKGSMAKREREKVKRFVGENGITETVIHGLYVYRCLDHFAEALAEATDDIETIYYGIVGARRDDFGALDRRRMDWAINSQDTARVVGALDKSYKFFEKEEGERFRSETELFIV